MDCTDAATQYSMVFSAYESFNGYSLTLKGWSVTVALAGMLAAYSNSVTRNGRIALVLATLSTVPFWWIDALFKSWQQGYERVLESFESSCEAIVPVMGLWSEMHVSNWDGLMADLQAWFGQPEGAGPFLMLLYPGVFLPHALILVAGLILAIGFPPRTEAEAPPRRKTLR